MFYDIELCRECYDVELCYDIELCRECYDKILVVVFH